MASRVTQEEVFRVFSSSTERLRALLLDVIGALPATADLSSPALHALDGITHDLDTRLATTDVKIIS